MFKRATSYEFWPNFSKNGISASLKFCIKYTPSSSLDIYGSLIFFAILNLSKKAYSRPPLILKYSS
jgi:hypothetical protein